MPGVRHGENQFAVADRAGDVGHVVFGRPGDVRLGHVALAVRTDGHQLLVRADGEDQAAGKHRRGRDFAVESLDAPELGAVLRRVGDDPGHGQA